MPATEANGVRLYYEIHGGGEPLVLVHGSWVDATRWRFVVPGLAESFRVLVYDRRGHSRSERPDRPGSVDEDGDDLAAARQFVEEVAFGPGAWDNELPPEMRAIFVRNAPTYLGELQDPNQLHIDEGAVSRLELSVRLTEGSESPPTFPAVIDRPIGLIPHASRETIDGAGHVPQLTHPERYVEVVTRVARANGPATARVR